MKRPSIPVIILRDDNLSSHSSVSVNQAEWEKWHQHLLFHCARVYFEQPLSNHFQSGIAVCTVTKKMSQTGDCDM